MSLKLMRVEKLLTKNMKKHLVDVNIRQGGNKEILKDAPLFSLSSVRFRIVSPSPSLTCSLDDTGTAEIGIDLILVQLTIRCKNAVVTNKQILLNFSFSIQTNQGKCFRIMFRPNPSMR